MALWRLITGLIVAAGCATIPWLAWRATRTVLSTIAGMSLAVIVVGAIVGIGLYPLSDVVVLVRRLAADYRDE